jgi:hypothetical protein
MRHTLVFSDIHLQLAAPDDGVWMQFRQRRYFPDAAFASLVERLLASLGADETLEVCWNGDTFELDGAAAYLEGLDAPDLEAGRPGDEARRLGRILADHPVFMGAVGRLLDRAERLVFLAGNHDLGLAYPEVQAGLRRAIVDAAIARGVRGSREALGRRVVFRPWLHLTSDGVLVEHGHRYDRASTGADPLVAQRGDGPGLYQPLGTAGYRFMLGGIGTMNPHHEHAFILGGARAYARHYVRYYLGQGRSIVRPWLFGALRSAATVLGQRDPRAEPSAAAREAALAEAARQNRIPVESLRTLRDRGVRPIGDAPRAVLRELWLDRLGLAAAAVVLPLLGGLLWSWAAAAVLLGLALAAMVVNEKLTPDNVLLSYEPSLPGHAEAAARATGARVVCLGHTHHAGRERLPGGATLINTGSWAPAFKDPECTEPVNQERTFAWIASDRGVITHAALASFVTGEVAPVAGRLPTDDALPLGTRRRVAA